MLRSASVLFLVAVTTLPLEAKEITVSGMVSVEGDQVRVGSRRIHPGKHRSAGRDLELLRGWQGQEVEVRGRKRIGGLTLHQIVSPKWVYGRAWVVLDSLIRPGTNPCLIWRSEDSVHLPVGPVANRLRRMRGKQVNLQGYLFPAPTVGRRRLWVVRVTPLPGQVSTPTTVRGRVVWDQTQGRFVVERPDGIQFRLRAELGSLLPNLGPFLGREVAVRGVPLSSTGLSRTMIVERTINPGRREVITGHLRLEGRLIQTDDEKIELFTDDASRPGRPTQIYGRLDLLLARMNGAEVRLAVRRLRRSNGSAEAFVFGVQGYLDERRVTSVGISRFAVWVRIHGQVRPMPVDRFRPRPVPGRPAPSPLRGLLQRLLFDRRR